VILPLAHGIESRADLPIPAWMFAWAAAVVLLLSFAALATMWKRPLLQDPEQGRPVAPLGVWADVVLGVVGLATWAVCVYAGFAGTQIAGESFTTNIVFVIMWVGFPIASLLFGDVFRLLSPWRAVARAVAFLAARFTKGDLPAPLPYPKRLGFWPVVLGILGFAWLELVDPSGNDPTLLAILAIAYMAVMLIGMSVYGIEAWSRNADPLGVYFGLFARLSPWARRQWRLILRRPGVGVAELDRHAGVIALLCVAIGTTTFDGLTSGQLWANTQPHLISLGQDLGLAYTRATEFAYTIGIVACVAFIALVYEVGIAGMRRIRGADVDPSTLGRRFVGSLTPIALAYVVAHYISLLAFQGQSFFDLVGNPLGRGADPVTIDYSILSANSIWYIQVVALVAGHVAGLALAHDRALAIYRDPRAATRSQTWMLGVMVAFTCLGLWLLSEANK
jgi:hypothetical protein